MIVSYPAPELHVRLINIRIGVTPPKLDRINDFAPHVSNESGDQCSFVALIFRQIWIDVVGKQKPFNELSRMNRAAWRNEVRNVKRLSPLHASAEPPNDARRVHQPVKTRLAHLRRLAASQIVRHLTIVAK